MNSKIKLPKIDILFQYITFLRHLVFPIIILVINAIQHIPWWGSILGFLGLSIILLIFAYIGWRNFSYLFQTDRLVIYSGLFTKKEKTIYYQRIHSVNISQNIIHRLLNLANLTIETPGVAVGGADGEIRCLSLDKARHLQSLLQHMGEASRNDATETQESLLKSIVSNMENSTSKEIVDSTIMPYSDDSNKQEKQDVQSVIEANTSSMREADKPEVSVALDSKLMFKSAITSMNLNIVLIWFVGLFTFADDVFNVIFPESTFIEDFFDNFDPSKFIVVFVLVVVTGAIISTWILSLVFYLIKFFDYKLERKGKQIHVSYGLLNRQAIVFNETKVQTLVFEENPLRQWLGYGELKVNIVKNSYKDNTQLSNYVVIHPFIRKTDVEGYIKNLMPKRELHKHEDTEKLPLASLRTYLFVPTLLSLLPALGAAYWLHWSTLWLLIIVIPVVLWRYIQFRSSAFSIDGSEMKLVSRDFAKQTMYVRRQNIVIMGEHASPYQRKQKLRKLSVNTLGGLVTMRYVLQGVSQEQMSRAKVWLASYFKK